MCRGLPWFLDGLNDTFEGKSIENQLLRVLVYFYLWPSILWSLLNLVPVWPLDGGRITRSLMVMFGGNVEQSLWISMVVAVSIAVYAFRFRDHCSLRCSCCRLRLRITKNFLVLATKFFYTQSTIHDRQRALNVQNVR